MNEFTRISAQSKKIDKKYMRVLYRSEKVGDVGYICMGIGGDSVDSLSTRILRYKYNGSMAFEYVGEVLFAMKIAKWHKNDD